MDMTIIAGLSSAFPDARYPRAVYFHLLHRIRESNSPEDLGQALAMALAWKDGKTRRVGLTDDADLELPAGRYAFERTKPATLSSHHSQVMANAEFFAWASAFQRVGYFELDHLRHFRERFNLWSTVVLPAFVLHMLSPRTHPLVDQHVMRAFRFVTAGEIDDRVSEASYAAYARWWASLVDCRLDLPRMKAYDEALWVLGRHLRRADVADDDGPRSDPQGPAQHASTGPTDGEQVTTGDAKFKRRVLDLWRSGGLRQLEAMRQGAREFGIDLPASYLKYPGSHIDRWKKQGF